MNFWKKFIIYSALAIITGFILGMVFGPEPAHAAALNQGNVSCAEKQDDKIEIIPTLSSADRRWTLCRYDDSSINRMRVEQPLWVPNDQNDEEVCRILNERERIIASKRGVSAYTYRVLKKSGITTITELREKTSRTLWKVTVATFRKNGATERIIDQIKNLAYLNKITISEE